MLQAEAEALSSLTWVSLNISTLACTWEGILKANECGCYVHEMLC